MTSISTAVSAGSAVTDAAIARAPSRWSTLLFVLVSVALLVVIVAMIVSVFASASDPMTGT